MQSEQQNFNNKNYLQSGMSIDKLLNFFNEVDSQNQGFITIVSAFKMLKQCNGVYVKAHSALLFRLGLQHRKYVAFDEYLAMLWESSFMAGWPSSGNLSNSYLIAYTSMLRNNHKKCLKRGQYLEAENIEKKIREIKNRQFKRQQIQMQYKYQNNAKSVEALQRKKMGQFRKAWHLYLEEYERQALFSLEKMKQKHRQELKLEKIMEKQKQRAMYKPSKNIIQLKSQERLLVKKKQYKLAQKIRKEVKILQTKQKMKYNLQIEKKISHKLQILQKYQQISLKALLNKIQSERKLQMHKKAQDQELIMQKQRVLQSQISEQYNIQMKDQFEQRKPTNQVSMNRRNVALSIRRKSFSQNRVPIAAENSIKYRKPSLQHCMMKKVLKTRLNTIDNSLQMN